jgi:type II secretory pathway pseudopilin PulG
MKRLIRNVKGFTLIEMILYVAICSGLLLSLALFFVYIIGQRVKNQAIVDVNQQGQQVIWLVTQTVRNGRSINSPGIGASSTSLSITTGNALLDPTIFDVTASGTLEIKEGSTAYVPLTNSHVTVSTITFQNISSASSTDRVLRLNFTLTYNNPSGKPEYDYTKSFTGSATIR